MNGDLRVRLTWNDPATGDPQERTLPLPVSFGRDASNTISLLSQQLSRQHARLEVQNNQVVLIDLNSTNGTFVNGQRVSQATLADGASFTIGGFAFTLTLDPQQLVFRWNDPQTGQPREVLANLPVTLGRDTTSSVVLPGNQVSRRHATIEQHGNDIVLTDGGSANGTFLNGRRQQQARIRPGDTVQIGPYIITIDTPGAAQSTPVVSNEQTLMFSPDTGQLVPNIPAAPAAPAATPPASAASPQAPAFPPPIFDQPIVPVAALQHTGLPVDATTYLSVGGGLGSFIWADNLVIYGADPRQMVVLGPEPEPYARYKRLCMNSQIPLHERLRSNSDSTPDNIWGWPGYAVREAWDDVKHGRIGHALKLMWQIFGEPTLYDTYTPRAGAVFSAIDREAARIGWGDIWRYGLVRAIRKTDDGRYVVAYSQRGRGHGLILAQYVHIATGYPAIQFLPDLQDYRQRTNDFRSIVNAYEDHQHVYEHLVRHGGVVLLRGRGIVASRIIQRIHELRRQNPQIGILHLMRTPNPEGNKYGRTQREVENHFEFQPFNWPKATWGGDMRSVLENGDAQVRDQLLNDWGGTTTADRSDWREIVSTGLREGWYQIEFGDVERVERDNQTGKIVTFIRGKGVVQNRIELPADFIIDATGLDAKIKSDPLLKDLVDTYHLPLNSRGRLQVANDFEIAGMQQGASRMYAVGAITLGGPYAPVDSFLGLHYAAQRIVETLCDMRAPNLRRLSGLRSVGQWMRWARGTRP